jgi:hypothetical protein
MSSCGISLNLSSLESKITAHFSAVIGISGLAGLPYMTMALLAGLALSRGNILAAIQIVVPSGAFDGLWKGMRSEFANAFSLSDVPTDLGLMQQNMADAVGAESFDLIGVSGSYDALSDPALAGSWGGTDTFLGKLGEIGADFYSGAQKFAKSSGLDQLSGYVDINVTDLAKTAIGLGGSWDSCDFGTGGIQNFFKDPSTGAIKLLANYAPKLGDASVAQSNSSWGMTAAVNSIFQSGKTSVKLQLQTAIGNVVSSAVGEGVDYSLNELGVTKLDERDISNMKQHINNYISPNPSLQVMKGPDGTRSVISTQNTALLRSKIANSFSASEHLNVMNIKDKYPDVFANININF